MQDPHHRPKMRPPGHPFDWQLVQSTFLLQDRWLSLRADTCQLPNGHMVSPYYVLEYPSWVNVVALTQDDHIVLVRQYRHGIRQTVVELPAGTVEPSDASPQRWHALAILRQLLGAVSRRVRRIGHFAPGGVGGHPAPAGTCPPIMALGYF
jgi:hypothetical protein